MFTAGSLRLQQSGLTAVDFFDRVTDIEEEGLAPNDDDIVVPPINVEITEEQLNQLETGQ